MTISRVNPPNWGVGDSFTSAQANALDINIVKAIDGAAGGTYAPSAPISMGGSGFALTGANNKVSSGATFTVEAGGVLNASGEIISSGGMQIDGGIVLNSGLKVELNSRTIKRSTFKAADYLAAAFTGFGLYIQSVGVGLGLAFFLELDLPDGATLNQIKAFISPVVAGRAGLPVTPPNLALAKVNLTTGATTTLFVQNDTSGNVLAYEAYHPITKSGLIEVIDRTTYRYVVQVSQESNANAIAGCKYYGVEWSVTVTQLDDGAG